MRDYINCISGGDQVKFTALHAAVEFDYTDIARLLIERGAYVNSMAGGWTLLRISSTS